MADVTPEDVGKTYGVYGRPERRSVTSFSGTLEKKITTMGCCSSWKPFYYHMPAGAGSLLEYKVKPHVDSKKKNILDHYSLPHDGSDTIVVDWKNEEGTLVLKSKAGAQAMWTLRPCQSTSAAGDQSQASLASKEGESKVVPAPQQVDNSQDDISRLFRTLLDHGALDKREECKVRRSATCTCGLMSGGKVRRALLPFFHLTN